MSANIKKESARQIGNQVANNSIILFWDTCSLLDIIRLPYRNSTTNNLVIYKKVKDLIKSGAIRSIASELTLTELNTNIQSVISEYDNYLKRLQKDFNLHQEHLLVSAKTSGSLLSSDFRDMGLKEYLLALYEDILENTTFISEQQSYNEFAHFRVSYHLPPAQKKGEYKDCYIWASCIDLAKEITTTNSTLFFFSRNREDFFDNGQLYNQIQTDSDNNRIKVRTEVGDLFGEINHYLNTP